MKTRPRRPGGQCHAKKALNPNLSAETSEKATHDFAWTPFKEKHLQERECVSFKAKSFCSKRLALFDVGIGPQQTVKKRQKIVSALDVSNALGQLQAILHHFK